MDGEVYGERQLSGHSRKRARSQLREKRPETGLNCIQESFFSEDAVAISFFMTYHHLSRMERIGAIIHGDDNVFDG